MSREIAFRPETNVNGFPLAVWLVNCGTMNKQKGTREETDPQTGEIRHVPNPTLIKGIYLRTEGGEVMMFGSIGSAQDYIDTGQAAAMWQARLDAIALEPEIEMANLEERLEMLRMQSGIPARTEGGEAPARAPRVKPAAKPAAKRTR